MRDRPQPKRLGFFYAPKRMNAVSEWEINTKNIIALYSSNSSSTKTNNNNNTLYREREYKRTRIYI
jgi:hypothetical protein